MGASIEHGIPLFLDQLISMLELEQAGRGAHGSRNVPGELGGGRRPAAEIGETASRHGLELWRDGCTVEQVVYAYGDVCQAITDLAFELDAPVRTDEFRTLNRCLDNAIADAVRAFSQQRDAMFAGRAAEAMNERLGALAHELRNLVHTATLALGSIKSGSVGFGGATGAVLDRSMIGLNNLMDRSLAEARLSAGVPPHRQLMSLADFIGEVQISAVLEAQARRCEFEVAAIDPELAIHVDRELLLSALGNLVQNAFKFTAPSSKVSVTAYAAEDRIHIDVEDHCGGLPAGDAEQLFDAYTQSGQDRSGLGLGLSIARRSAEANAGTLTVHDLPGSGCIFTISLPRHELKPQFS